MLQLGATVQASAALDGLEVLAGTPKQAQLWQRLAMLQRQNIMPPRGRIAERRDENDETYPPSKRFERDNQQGRRKRSGGAYTLWDQGHMLPAITVKGVSSFGSRLGFNSVSEAQKAGWHHFGTVRLPRRAFWGISPRDLEALEKYKAEYIAEAIRRSKLGR